jgi:hypothetical protein
MVLLTGFQLLTLHLHVYVNFESKIPVTDSKTPSSNHDHAKCMILQAADNNNKKASTSNARRMSAFERLRATGRILLCEWQHRNLPGASIS